MKEIITRALNNLQLPGAIIFVLLLIIGLRAFWDSNRYFIPHVLEFNMYIHSFSSEDGTEFPDVKITNVDGVFKLDKAKIKLTSMGYIHLSDRWDFYPPLYDAYFCDADIAEVLGYKISKDIHLEISYIKNYSEVIRHQQELECT